MRVQMPRRNAKQKRQARQNHTLPPPADKNCIKAIFIWKSNKEILWIY
jgi:hypothetical protein